MIMNKINRLFKGRGLVMSVSLFHLFTFSSLSAQEKLWSLRECCDYAVEHSISIKQQENLCRQQELELSTAKNSRLPEFLLRTWSDGREYLL